MSRYDAVDRYTYPGSDVLIYKPGLRQAAALEAFEADATAILMLELLEKPIPGTFDVSHLREVHRYLFQDVYDWAGDFRLVDISRGSSRFANFPLIDNAARRGPLPIIVSAVEAVASHSSCSAKMLWKHLFQWAHELQSPRQVWT